MNKQELRSLIKEEISKELNEDLGSIISMAGAFIPAAAIAYSIWDNSVLGSGNLERGLNNILAKATKWLKSDKLKKVIESPRGKDIQKRLDNAIAELMDEFEKTQKQMRTVRSY